MYIDVYKGEDNFVTSGATLLSDLDLQETYKAINSVATGRVPSLFCAYRYMVILAIDVHNTDLGVDWSPITEFFCCYIFIDRVIPSSILIQL